MYRCTPTCLDPQTHQGPMGTLRPVPLFRITPTCLDPQGPLGPRGPTLDVSLFPRGPYGPGEPYSLYHFIV